MQGAVDSRARLTQEPGGLKIQGVLPKSGPVAQLGARFHGMEEVIGSIPIRSTNLKSSTYNACSDALTVQ